MHQGNKAGDVRICFFGTFDVSQPRTRVLLEGLREAGAQVIECSVPLWSGTSEKVTLARRPWMLARRLGSVFLAYCRLAIRAFRLGRCDAVIYAHLGQIDVILTSWWFKLRGIPVVWDALISLYDTVVQDRGLLKERSFWTWWLRQIDRLAGRLADLVLVDTRQNERFWHIEFRVPRSKLRVIHVGAEDFFAHSEPQIDGGSRLDVLFYGKYIPLHGVETIIRAAKELEPFAGIRFTLIGTGQERPYIDSLAAQLQLTNVSFIDWVNYPELLQCIADADICLGIFGSTDKTKRVVPNKAYQALASQRPLVTADTPAARDLLLGRGVEGALVVAVADEKALAEAILGLAASAPKRADLARNGYALYQKYYSSKIIGQKLMDVLMALSRLGVEKPSEAAKC